MRRQLPQDHEDWAQDTKRVHLKPDDAIFGWYLYVGKGADVRYDVMDPSYYPDPDIGEDYLAWKFEEPFAVPIEVDNKLFVYILKDAMYYWYIREEDSIYRVFVGVDKVNVWLMESII